jgi:predicted dehydrogenase
MGERLRIGVIGLIHDHVWDNLAHLAAAAGAELAAVADANEPLRQRVADKYGCPTYESAEQMVEAESLDAVYVYSDNRTGAELGAWAAGRELHVMIEKPMAARLDGAEAMLAAADASGVRIMVNWPFVWWPQLQQALAMAQGGDLGRIWQVKYRAAHAGPRELGCSEYFCGWLYDENLNGAGALMDYCCYGSVLASALLGLPKQVTGVKGRLVKDDIDVDDNAVLVMLYDDAIATAEASWTQVGKLSAYTTVIYGTEGTMMFEPRLGGRLFRCDAETPAGVEVPVPDPPPHRVNSAEHFIHCITTGEEFFPLCRPRTCRDAQAILEAGLISSQTGKTVSL